MLIDTLNLNGLRNWSGHHETIHYVYPGTVDVQLGTGIKFQTKDSQIVELGDYLGEGEVSSDMLMDDAHWQWRATATDRRAQVWVKHVMVAEHLRRTLGYEFDDELVLVGHRLPPRQAELLLWQAGFRPSLATWRAKANAERRARLSEFAAILGGERPAEPGPVTPIAATTKELKPRAQHAWMRWHAIFEDELVIAGRTYQVRGRPVLGDRELVVNFRHSSSGAELAMRFDVAAHVLQYKATAIFSGQMLEREALAWEEFSAFASDVGDAIKPSRPSTNKGAASPVKATAPSSASPIPATVEQPSLSMAPPPPATQSPVADIEVTQAQVRESVAPPPATPSPAADIVRDLVLPPHRRSAYLARVAKAAERGDNSKRILSEATKESRLFMAERAAQRRPGPGWDEALVHAFEREPGWRLDVVPRAVGHTLAIYPDGRALEDAVASIDVREHAIGDVRWLSGDITPAVQDELLGRVQRALQVARAGATGEPPPSPLEGRIDEVIRRSVELGINSDVLSGAPQGAMARALRELGDPLPSAPSELIRWLQANRFGPVAALIEDWHDGDGPADMDSLSRALWKAVEDSVNMTPVHAHGSGWQTDCGAIFSSRDEERWVLVRRTRQSGAYEVHKLNVLVRKTGGDSGWSDTCEIEDTAGMLREGDQLCLVDGESGPQDTIELHRRIAEFITEVERTPKRLQDVRRILFWTAAMIDTPRCQGAHRAAARRAFERAKDYYDTARRSLARGDSVVAFQRVHNALRRISEAAAWIAQACAEGQQTLADRITSEFAPRVEPAAEDTVLMRIVESEVRRTEPAANSEIRNPVALGTEAIPGLSGDSRNGQSKEEYDHG